MTKLLFFGNFAGDDDVDGNDESGSLSLHTHTRTSNFFTFVFHFTALVNKKKIEVWKWWVVVKKKVTDKTVLA